MCAFGNGCMTVGYRRGIMQIVGEWDSGTVGQFKIWLPKVKKKILYLYIYIYRYIDIEE